MTGIIFAHLPSVCTGKLTYLSASYWQNVATTLLAARAEPVCCCRCVSHCLHICIKSRGQRMRNATGSSRGRKRRA